MELNCLGALKFSIRTHTGYVSVEGEEVQARKSRVKSPFPESHAAELYLKLLQTTVIEKQTQVQTLYDQSTTCSDLNWPPRC